MRRCAVLLLLAAALGGQNKLSPVDEAAYRSILKSNVGSVVLMDFWATWCAPCRQELPQFAKLESRLHDKRFRLVTISADDPEKEAAAVEFLKKSGISGTAYLRRAKDDDKFIAAVDAKWSGALPALFLYNQQGKLVKSFVGETETSVIEAAIRKVL